MCTTTELADKLHTKHNGEGLLAYCEAELRRLERVNAELVEVGLLFWRWAQASQDFRYPPGALQQLTAALTPRKLEAAA